MTIWAIVTVVAALVAIFFVLRLAGDLAAIAVMVIGGVIKLLTRPFRHKH